MEWKRRLQWAGWFACIPFLLAGAVNQGLTSAWLALPFLIVWLPLTFHLMAPRWAVLWLTITLLPAGWLFKTTETNRWLYPVIGATITLSAEKWLVMDDQTLTLTSVRDISPARYEGMPLLEKTIMVRVDKVTQRFPDFGQLDVLHVQDVASGQRYQLDGRKLAAGVKDGGALLSEHANTALHKGSYTYRAQSDWSYYLSGLMMWPVLFFGAF